MEYNMKQKKTLRFLKVNKIFSLSQKRPFSHNVASGVLHFKCNVNIKNSYIWCTAFEIKLKLNDY